MAGVKPTELVFELELGGIQIRVIRKRVKNLSLRVYPPDGDVRVTAPLHLSGEDIRRFVEAKLGWINKHREGVKSQPHSGSLRYISGELHYLEGRAYVLNVIPNAAVIRVQRVSDTQIDLQVRPDTTLAQLNRLFDSWHAARLQARARPLLAKWQERMGVRISSFYLRRMKTRWGTCNVDTKRICLNLELARRSDACLEFIVVHELVHLLHHRHGAAFDAYMDSFLPAWRVIDAELQNRHPR